MKTQTIKTVAITTLMAIAMGANAQTDSQKTKKTCIKIHESINGKEINIDTCFTGFNMGSIDIKKKLAAMGITDMPDLNGVLDSAHIGIDVEGGDGDSTKPEVIVIKHNGDGEDGDKGEEIKVIHSKNGESNAIIMNDDGDASATGGKNGETSVVVESINGNVTIETNGTGKSTKVYVYKKVIIKNISADDKKLLPAEASSAGAPFTHLTMSPNPTEGTVTVAYTSVSDEPLQMDVYDMNGKKMHTETISNIKGQVNKTLSLNSYGAGIYFVHLTQGNQAETRKIVVK